MSGNDNTSMLPYSTDYNIAAREQSTASPSGSRQNSLLIDEETFSTFYALWFWGREGFVEFRPRPNASHAEDANVKAACAKWRASFALNEKTKDRLLAHLKRCSKDSRMVHTGIYIGVNPRNTALRREWDVKSETSVRVGGRNEDVEFYIGVIFDLDDHHASDAESLSHGAEMLQELARIGYPPTFTVKSGTGGGIHGWYRLTIPVDVPTGRRLSKKLAILLKSDMAVTNPSRVMRLPGSWNTKSGNVVPVNILEVSGEVHDPVSFETALEMVARENGIDLSEAECGSSSEGYSGEAGEWPSVTIEEARRITEVCARMAFYATKEGANSMSYNEWFGMATIYRSLNPQDSSLFDELSKLYDGHKPREIRDKWKNVRNTSPVSCAWFQAERPLPQCESCRFFQKNREGGERI
ncbi:hypothetical protein AAC03nite_26550 [Alicyclobacillus acidoterrestris]|nr:hypothetical protein AAC03nite_26550 [Alicyclobacillus acidoterrestris]